MVTAISSRQLVIYGGNRRSMQQPSSVVLFNVDSKTITEIAEVPFLFISNSANNQTYVERDGVALSLVDIKGFETCLVRFSCHTMRFDIIYKNLY